MGRLPLLRYWLLLGATRENICLFSGQTEAASPPSLSLPAELGVSLASRSGAAGPMLSYSQCLSKDKAWWWLLVLGLPLFNWGNGLVTETSQIMQVGVSRRPAVQPSPQSAEEALGEGDSHVMGAVSDQSLHCWGVLWGPGGLYARGEDKKDSPPAQGLFFCTCSSYTETQPTLLPPTKWHLSTGCETGRSGRAWQPTGRSCFFDLLVGQPFSFNVFCAVKRRKKKWVKELKRSCCRGVSSSCRNACMAWWVCRRPKLSSVPWNLVAQL